MIWDKAQDLGRQIGQSAEYQALRRAEATLREDKDTVAKLDQIQTLARQVDQQHPQPPARPLPPAARRNSAPSQSDCGPAKHRRAGGAESTREVSVHQTRHGQ